MRLKDVLDHYGNIYRFERDSGMSHNSYYNWARRGYIPIVSQIKLERLTEGKLQADLSHTVKDESR